MEGPAVEANAPGGPTMSDTPNTVNPDDHRPFIITQERPVDQPENEEDDSSLSGEEDEVAEDVPL